jgi:PHD/YefM family antitoxin component YafN of YafNO toxin-antitoxin module
MSISASKLRENIYRVLDQVAETGEPVEILRNGRRLQIILVEAPRKRSSKLDRLEPRPDAFTGDTGDLVHLDWSAGWKP